MTNNPLKIPYPKPATYQRDDLDSLAKALRYFWDYLKELSQFDLTPILPDPSETYTGEPDEEKWLGVTGGEAKQIKRFYGQPFDELPPGLQAAILDVIRPDDLIELLEPYVVLSRAHAAAVAELYWRDKDKE